MNYQEYLDIKKTYKNSSNKRIFIELDYCQEINRIENGKYNDLIDLSFFQLKKELKKGEILSQASILKIEKILMPMQERIKSDSALCVAHAHIDINWMWGYDETVSVTISTIETMLKLMKKYPKFTYTQSQGFVYDIIAKYRPDLLKKIIKYIKRGQFEVTASTYIEGDKNLSNAETQLSQLIYNKKHLSSLLHVPMDYLNIDFEPDTFGHSAYVPEILAACGVKYYYHCRGNENPPFYRFAAPSGKSVLVYREPKWYISSIDDDSFNYIADFCHRYKINKALKVYGVGDHGGGASLRDIERIIEMQKYPLLPTIEFSTFHEYFNYIENTLKDLPVYQSEQNQIFTGCYSSNSKIKEDNKKAQVMLYNANVYSALSEKNQNIDEAKRIIFVNEFHDILPGTGVKETNDYSLGKFQEAFAILGQSKEKSLQAIVNKIDTRHLFINQIRKINEDISIGAGVGFKNKNIDNSTHLAYGNERAFVIFNSLNFERTVDVTIPLWDFFGDINQIKVYDDQNNALPYVLKSPNTNFYWSHNYHEIVANVILPPLGYTSIVIREAPHTLPEICYPPMFQRIEEPKDDIVLENEYIKATFDNVSFVLKSIINKETSESLISSPCEFKYVLEDTTNQMTSWYVGRYKLIDSLHKNLRYVPNSYIKTPLYQMFAFEGSFQSSAFRITITLKNKSKELNYKFECDFFERGSSQFGVPQIRFEVPCSTSFNKVTCDVPLGTIVRNCTNRDVCCSSFVSTSSLALIGASKHGFRAFDNTIGLTLLRGTYDPHPYQDYGHHCIEFVISIEKNIENLRRISLDFRYPANVVSTFPHEGNMPTTNCILPILSNVDIVSMNYSNDSLLICLFNNNDNDENISLKGIGYKSCYTSENAFIQDIEVKDMKIVIPSKSIRFIRLNK